MASAVTDPRVWLVRDRPVYCQTPPFHPSEELPEWPFSAQATQDNPAYRGVRRLFHDMGLDAASFGTREWNPLGDMIRPGQTVVLKPNLVTHFNHGTKHLGLTDTDSLVTHGSVVRAVADYAGRAASPGGTLLICDCPLQGTDWAAVVKLTGLDQVVEHLRRAFPSVEVRLVDYRAARADVRGGRVVRRVVAEPRPEEYIEVDLGTRSLFDTRDNRERGFGVSQYSSRRMRFAHTATVNKYLIPRAVLEADVLINLPKMKTHMKAGVTCALKNLVGINGHKDYLPHFRSGSPRVGGDEYPDGNWWWDLTWKLVHRDWELDGGPLKSVLGLLGRVCMRVSPLFGGFPRHRYELGGGSWSGNDTAWRMVLDVNRALFYYDARKRAVADEPSSHMAYLAIVDALVAGEGAGPLSPRPVAAGLLLASYSAVAVDTVATAMMGFDSGLLPMIARAYDSHALRLATFLPADVRILDGGESHDVDAYVHARGLVPFSAWIGFRGSIERAPLAGALGSLSTS